MANFENLMQNVLFKNSQNNSLLFHEKCPFIAKYLHEKKILGSQPMSGSSQQLPLTYLALFFPPFFFLSLLYKKRKHQPLLQLEEEEQTQGLVCVGAREEKEE